MLVACDLYVVSESAWSVVFVPVVIGSVDVVDTWGSVVEWDACVVTTTVVLKSVFAVVAMAVVGKVDV